MTPLPAQPTAASIGALLCQLADPERPPPPILDATQDAAIRTLTEAAEQHGVYAIVARKLRATRLARRLAGSAADDGRIISAAGQVLLLQHHAVRIMARLSEAKVPAAIVKGPVFARRLYPVASDRPFTDIDVMVDLADIPRANDIIAGAGFELAEKAGRDRSGHYQEFKWYRAEGAILIELHANLVHYPGLRRRVSFGLPELLLLGDGDPEAPGALLGVAIIHAACGHKFHRLRFLVDILQAARALPPETTAAFVSNVGRIGMTLEAAAALALTSRLFAEPRAIALAEALARNAPRGRRLALDLSRRLLTPKAVLDAPNRIDVASRIRRHAFRWLQLIPAARA